MNFAPVSCMCLYCKERTFVTEPLDKVTCSRCEEVAELVRGEKLGPSRIPVSLGEKASSLPVVQKTVDNSKTGNIGRKTRTHMKKIYLSNIGKRCE
ncbi:hypothetical protein [Methanolobus sp.]|uniref:hypothetical protein n=1 Tax=Methanolobus sp. TaxID=1874737 RepID=UPI0025F0DA45|nr:hypothetical protein [Methanolobus sp.]